MTISATKMFAPTTLTTGAATLYTVAGSTATVLANARVRFVNTSNTAVQVTAYAVPSGGSAATGNQFCPNMTVLGYGYIDVDVPNLNGGDFIAALASTGAVVVAQAMNAVLFF